MKISYAVNNLRSICDMDPVELRPITILVGANNSGKSTFLRSFSLFRQSIEENTNVPIFWAGNYTDFGDYLTSVKNMNSDNEISFEFVFEDFEFDYSLIPTKNGKKTKIGKTIPKLNYNFVVKFLNKKEYVSAINLRIENLGIDFKATVSNDREIEFYINNKLVTDEIKENAVFSDTMLFPLKEIGNKYRHLDEFLSPENPSRIVSNDNIIFVLVQNLSGLITDLIGPLPLNVKLHELYQRIVMAHPLNVDKLNALSNKSNHSGNKDFFESLIGRSNESFMSEVNRYCSIYIALKSLLKVQDVLERYLQSTISIGPIRAQSDRFFRLQGLDVSEISIEGRNLPMFLVSLELREKLDEFSDWFKEMIGYEVSIKRSTGLVSIFVKRGKLNVNICDSGVGIAQVLPILAQIWLNTLGRTDYNRNRHGEADSNFAYPITMEQPELHLHPVHQAELAEAFANIIRDEKVRALNPHFIIETHSEVLINKLGSLIRNGKLSHEDLQLVMFSNQNKDPETTQITTSDYDAEGILTNWPHGFFNY